MNIQDIDTETQNFSYYDWLEGRRTDLLELNALPGLPRLKDSYTPGPVTWGKDPERSRAVTNSRAAKARYTNDMFFVEAVLPLIEHQLSPASWRELAFAIEGREKEFLRRGGFLRYELGERGSWIHQTDIVRLQAAQAMGATLIED